VLFSLYARCKRALFGVSILPIATSVVGLTVGMPNSVLAADTYPTRPIRLVVPYPPGGGPDILARILGENMGTDLGQSVVVENRAGAGGNIGAQAVARSDPDGYTLLVCAFSCGVSPLIYDPAPFDLQQDFEPVALLGKVPSVLLVNTKLPLNNLKEFMQYAKAHPNELNAASSGIGSSPHFAIELLRSATDTDLTHIPYKGSGQVTGDLLGGQVDVFFDNLSPALPNIKAGKLRALAVTSEQRAPSLPDVPTFVEHGYPNFVITPWFALMAPATTPPEILDRLNKAVNDAFQEPKIADKIKHLGIGEMGGSRSELATFLAAETQKWKRVVEEGQIKGQ